MINRLSSQFPQQFQDASRQFQNGIKNQKTPIAHNTNARISTHPKPARGIPCD